MPQTKHSSAAAIAWARSLIDLANEKKQAEAIGQELSSLADIVNNNPTFQMYLADPGISETERGGAIQRIFGSQVSPLVRSFLGVLNQHGALRMIPAIAQAYDFLLDEQVGKVEVDVTVAQKLSPDQLEQVRQKVSTALKKDAVVHQYVDDSIIGGLVLRVRDQLIDASVKHQLEAMKEKLLAAKSA